MESVSKTLGELSLGDEIVFKNVTMFPLLSGSEGTVDYLTLGDALELEVARVVEVSAGGSVPELLFENTADLPVLILDGEELVGAKQNRTVNLTILAPPGKTITIPVTCVEQGRWSRESDQFATSERHHFARGRAAKVASVSRSLRSAGSRHADQGEVWAEISHKAACMEAASPTQAMAAIFDRHRTSVRQFVEAIKPAPQQTGAIFAIGSRVVGLDLFDHASTLTNVVAKLVASYAIDAIEETSGESCGAGEAKAFFEIVASAGVESYQAIGLGSDLRLVAPGIVGGGLAVEDRLIHLAAFAAEQGAAGGRRESGGMARVLDRRRAYRRR